MSMTGGGWPRAPALAAARKQPNAGVSAAGTYAAIPADEDVLAIGINRAVALVTDKEIRESRARGPKQVLRRLGRHPGDGAPV